MKETTFHKLTIEKDMINPLDTRNKRKPSDYEFQFDSTEIPM
jgi:hypothetical protein